MKVNTAMKTPRRSGARVVGRIPLGMVALFFGAFGQAEASDFVVATLADAELASSASADCVSTLGPCTLRAAIHAAENAGAGPHRIALRVAGTYVLTLGPLTIDGTTVLIENTSVVTSPTGARVPGRVILDGVRKSAVLVVGSSSVADVRIVGLRIQRGADPTSGGGITKLSGTVSLTDVTLYANSVVYGGSKGGAIYNNTGATMMLTKVAVLRNIVGAGGEGTSGWGGGIYNAGTMTLANVTVSGNGGYAVQGGGIFNEGTLTIVNSILSANGGSQAYGGGGGIYNTGSLVLANSTLSGNSSALPGGGGGIYNNGGIWGLPGTMTLTNVTITGNAAPSGGGIENSLGTVTLTNVTVSGNSSPEVGGVWNLGTMTLSNSIVANNVGLDCEDDGMSYGGGSTFSGVNIIRDGSCASTGVLAVNPKLGTLGFHGGAVPTIPPQDGSPAIDAVAYTLPCPSTDARGQLRPAPGALGGFAQCDLGAYEVQRFPPR